MSRYAELRRKLRHAKGLTTLAVFATLIAGPCTGLKLYAQNEVISLADIPIEQDADLLLLPSTINDKRYLFWLDTGSTYSSVDASLRSNFGNALARIEVPRMKGEVDLLPVEQVRVGGLPLVGGALSLDLSAMRANSHTQPFGIIGMSFLRERVVQIDMGQHRVRVLRSVMPTDDAPLTIHWSRNGRPYVRGHIEGWGDELFLVDTGCVGAGCVRTGIAEGLVERSLAQPAGKELTSSLGGRRTCRVIRLGGFRVGSRENNGLLFRTYDENIIGLAYLSRFIVMFDFPNSTIYLKEGTNLRTVEDDRIGRCAIATTRIGSQIVVQAVAEPSAAADAGLEPGDVIKRVNGSATVEMTEAELDDSLCKNTVNLDVERAGKRMLFTIARMRK